MPRLNRPVLVLHGDQDLTIPARQAEALSKLQPAARLVIIPGAGHNDIQRYPLYLDAIAGALAEL
jgi:pimeloyl-ACP methyl ester carboxylesterase